MSLKKKQLEKSEYSIVKTRVIKNLKKKNEKKQPKK